MKKLSVILITGMMVGLQPLQAQQPPTGAKPSFQQRVAEVVADQAKPQDPGPTRFDLDFPGGTPGELVKAIEKASGKPLNAIIREEDAGLQIPPVKLRSVTAAELFEALLSINNYNMQPQYGFTTRGNRNDDSIWYMYHEQKGPAHPAEIVRFFQLGPYLETYKVEDITTAIETGWKMLGGEPFPKMSFHKDTKLLIAKGEPEKLNLIASVLNQLPTNRPAAAKTSAPEQSGGDKK